MPKQSDLIESLGDKESAAKRERSGDQNWIRPAGRRTSRVEPAAEPPAKEVAAGWPRKARSVPKNAENKADPRGAESAAVPEDVAKRFVKDGPRYYFPDGARAFTDRGQKLTTPSENTEVVSSLIEIAHARGWEKLTVSGTERFRKEAWMAARMVGLDVKGYQPTPFEQTYLVRTMARSSLEREGVRSKPVDDSLHKRREPPARTRHLYSEREALILGRLADHGRAPYDHDSQAPMSYFVKLETQRGERTLWGVDLERALRESLTKPESGDLIGMRLVRRDPVTVKAREKDAEGKLLKEQDLATHRNRWIVEKQAFFATRAEAAQMVRDPKIDARRGVKEHPELAGIYLYLKGAREVAQRRIRDPEDQKKFVATVRGALAVAVARGDPLPPVRLRVRANERAKGRTPISVERQALVRDE